MKIVNVKRLLVIQNEVKIILSWGQGDWMWMTFKLVVIYVTWYFCHDYKYIVASILLVLLLNMHMYILYTLSNKITFWSLTSLANTEVALKTIHSIFLTCVMIIILTCILIIIICKEITKVLLIPCIYIF